MEATGYYAGRYGSRRIDDQRGLGGEVDRPPRRRIVMDLRILVADGPQEVYVYTARSIRGH